MSPMNRYIFVVLLALSAGCHPEAEARRQPPASAPATVIGGPMTPPGLSLHLWLARDTITTLDSLGVMYLMRNGGEPRTINMQPDHFQFIVEDVGGKRLLGGVFDRDQTFGDVHAIRIGMGGVIGQVVWLSCTSCAYGIDLDAPGRYTMRVRYSPPPAPGSRGDEPEPGQLVLVSDPVTFWVR